jgi:hypothetical protein
LRSSSDHERRRHRRLTLAFPIRYSGRAPAGSSFQGQGLTVDISSGGVRFETDSPEAVAPHTEVVLYITIPRHPESGESPVFLSGKATVVRCDAIDATSRRHTGAHWRLAARFHKHPDISLPIMEDFNLGTC